MVLACSGVNPTETWMARFHQNHLTQQVASLQGGPLITAFNKTGVAIPCTQGTKKNPVPLSKAWLRRLSVETDSSFTEPAPKRWLTSILTKNGTTFSKTGRKASLWVPKKEWRMSAILLKMYTSSSSCEEGKVCQQHNQLVHSFVTLLLSILATFNFASQHKNPLLITDNLCQTTSPIQGQNRNNSNRSFLTVCF